MEQSGIPLEIRARRQLIRLGYDAGRSYYEKENGLFHELDFQATKLVRSFGLAHGFNLAFHLLLLGECKHSETYDFFAFQAEKGDVLTIAEFPIRFSDEDIPNRTATIGSLQRYYGFSNVVERIVEVNAAKYQSHNKNYGDRVTHQACLRLLSAFKHFQKTRMDIDTFSRSIALSIIQSRYDALIESAAATPQQIVARLVTENIDVLAPTFNPLSVMLGVPLIVLDDNRGLVKTTLREDGTVHFIDDVDFVLYPYVPENVRLGFEVVGSIALLPVIICKQRALENVTTLLENGTRQLLLDASSEFQADLLLRKLLLTEIHRKESNLRKNVLERTRFEL